MRQETQRVSPSVAKIAYNILEEFDPLNSLNKEEFESKDNIIKSLKDNIIKSLKDNIIKSLKDNIKSLKDNIIKSLKDNIKLLEDNIQLATKDRGSIPNNLCITIRK